MVLSDLNIGKLGFSLSYVPINDEDDVIQDEFNKILEEFVSSGFNYIDSSYRFEDAEFAFEKAIRNKYDINSFKFCGKLATWYRVRSRVTAVMQYDEILTRTGSRVLDMLSLDVVGGKNTNSFDEYDMWSFLDTKKKLKKIRCIGMYFKGDAEELDKLLQLHNLDFVQLDIDADKWKEDANMVKCYEIVKKYNKPIIAMYTDKMDIAAENQIAAVKFISEMENVESVVVELDSVEKVRQYAKLFED